MSLRRLGLVLVTASLAIGCSRREAHSQPPTVASPPVYNTAYVAADTAPPAATQPSYEPVEITEQTVVEPTEELPDLVGYQTLSNGNQVQVVTYVHTYVETIETYPRVYWAGYWYYNVNGNFVFWSDYWGGWCMYWGPPMGLVYMWNYRYPWVAYTWGVGFYGPGWYWGGVSYIGYHSFGAPPHYYQRPVHPGRPHPGGSLGNAKKYAKTPHVGGPGAVGEASVGSIKPRPRPTTPLPATPSQSTPSASVGKISPQAKPSRPLSARPAKPATATPKLQAVPSPKTSPSQVPGAKFRPVPNDRPSSAQVHSNAGSRPSGKATYVPARPSSNPPSAGFAPPRDPNQPLSKPKATYRPSSPPSARPDTSPSTRPSAQPSPQNRPSSPSTRPSQPSSPRPSARPSRPSSPRPSARPSRPSRSRSVKPSRPSSAPRARPSSRGRGPH